MSTFTLPTDIGLSTRSNNLFGSSDNQAVIFSPPSNMVPFTNKGLNLMALNLPNDFK